MSLRRGSLLGAVGLLAVSLPAAAQMARGLGELEQKLAVVKQSLAENQERLHHYEWTETMELALKGDPKPQRRFLCRYAPDGTVQKTMIGAPPPPPSGGRLKRRIVEKKTEEMEQYMGAVKRLLAMYVPPDADKMARAYQAGNAYLNPRPGSDNTALVFKNYAQTGDQMTLGFDTVTKRVVSVDVNTYMDDPKDVVTLRIQMASLPDGTNYVQRSVLDATAKSLEVTTTNSDYQKLGQ